MTKSKRSALLVTLTVMLIGLSITSLLQSSQPAHSQQDYEEYIITETNNEQKLKQENVGSGSSTNINCGINVVTNNSPQPITTTCPSITGETPTTDEEFATTTVSNTVPLDPGSRIGTAEVSCPEGTQIAGGGYELRGVIPGSSEVHPWVDAPTDNGWKVSVNLGALEDNASLTVYAICGALVEPT